MPTLFVIPYPAIDPVALALGPIAIRWYALAYVIGILAGWRWVLYLARRPLADGRRLLSDVLVDDLIVWVTLGVILGGRLGYVAFYQPSHFLANPLQILALWQGGMSFHGGAVGVILAIVLFARLRRVNWLSVGDLVVSAVPIGLFLGRLANFVNGELYGRPSEAPWAMVFPQGGAAPRHPSQLYEAGLEGLVLFVLLGAVARYSRALDRPGLVAGLFLAGYAVARGVAEMFREPDAFLGYLAGGITMGQILSTPLLALGLYLIWRARARR